jgi:two-component system nitrogen regulation sensor histidine kinase NtrY
MRFPLTLPGCVRKRGGRAENAPGTALRRMFHSDYLVCIFSWQAFLAELSSLRGEISGRKWTFMSLRIKFFLLPALAIAAAAALVALGSTQYARRQFQQADQQRTQTLIAQFQREIAQRGDEVVRTVQGVADSEATLRMALDLSGPRADPSVYANDAHGLANIYHLDFLELTTADGTLISSSHWAPASGYRNDWVASQTDWDKQGAFLNRAQLPNTVELGLLAVRSVRVGDYTLYVIGGWRFDRGFLQTMAVPDGMRAMLYANLEPRFISEALTGPEGPVAEPEAFAPLVESLQRGEVPQPREISLPLEPTASTELFTTLPLHGRDQQLVGALLVGSSQQNLAALVSYIRSLGLAAVGFGILFSLLLSWWVSTRVNRPLAQLADAARDMQTGRGTKLQKLRPQGPTAPVATALSELPDQISRDRERLVQRERVAARREMARRFARELKESIFPLHMAAEDLLHAREESSERFDEIFFECSTSMRAELDRLKQIAVRFGEFARTPRPRLAPLGVNEAVRGALHAVEPQLNAAEHAVTPDLHLSESEAFLEADPDQLRMALENLLLHCLDAMPSGGTLAIRTKETDAAVRIEIAAKGATLNKEDCQRLFVPGGSPPEGMTGLGLATAHAIVNDHGGRMSAESVADTGVTIRLEFPAARVAAARQTSQPARQQAPQAADPQTVQTVAGQGTQPVAQEAPLAAVASPETTQPVAAHAAAEQTRQTPVKATQDLPVAAAPSEGSANTPQGRTGFTPDERTEIAQQGHTEVAQAGRTEVAREEHAEAAAAQQTEMVGPGHTEDIQPERAVTTPAEPVPVMVAVTEVAATSEKVENAAETPAQPAQPAAAPTVASRARDWLVLDKNSLRL